MGRALRWLAAATAAGMFLVLVMGAAVTNTGSAEGCGRSWPLCNGQFVPEFTVATAIEYSHRAVTGVEGVLVVALAGAMLVLWRADREVQVLAPLMLGTLILQAGLGAAAVMAPQSTAVLASHFGVSLVAFASTFLSASYVFAQTHAPAPEAVAGAGVRAASAPAAGAAATSASLAGRRSVSASMAHMRPAAASVAGARAAATRADVRPAEATVASARPASAARIVSEAPVPPGFRWQVLATGVYVLLVVYLGAYVRHAGVSLACADWPLCNGQVVPSFEGATGVVFAHRLAALGAVLLLGWLARSARSVGVGSGPAWHAFGLALVQSVSGALVVWLRLDLFSTLAHAAVVALLFAALCVLVRRVLLPRGARLGARRPATRSLQPTSV